MELFIIFLLFLFWLDSYRKTDMSKSDKREYLKSDKWHETRERIKSRDSYKCRGCGTTNKLEVHHISYRHLGNEYDSDLITLCRHWHQSIHDKGGYSHSREYPLSLIKK